MQKIDFNKVAGMIDALARHIAPDRTEGLEKEQSEHLTDAFFDLMDAALSVRCAARDEGESVPLASFMKVQGAIEDAILDRGVEQPADLADIVYVAAEAVTGDGGGLEAQLRDITFCINAGQSCGYPGSCPCFDESVAVLSDAEGGVA